MKILVVNSGSSSLKFQLIDMDTSAVLAKGVVDRIGIDGSGLVGNMRDGKKVEIMREIPDHVVAVKLLLDTLTDAEVGVIPSVKEIGAVGHRVVHNGGIFDAPALITEELLDKMKQTYDLAPLHNSAATKGAIACREAMPGVPMVLVFDTVFHNTMPPKAYMYAIPYSDYEQYKVRKYGFHGTSHMYVSRKAAEYLGKKPEELRTITCHLGNGASVAAVDHGKCADTSMGFTPLEGLVMGTRSGDMDLAALEFLCAKKGMTHAEGVQYVNKQCGVKGICGYSDFRDICAHKDEDAACSSRSICFVIASKSTSAHMLRRWAA